MKNNIFPLLTQKMIYSNPNLSGAYEIKEEIVSLRNGSDVCAGYVFLKDGLPHNDNGPAYISDDLRMIRYFINGKIRSGSLPSLIEYANKGKLKGLTFIPPKTGSISSRYYNTKEEYHCVSGPAMRESISSEHDQFCIHGKELSKEEWENHPEVIEYFGMIKLKEKMKKTFQEEGK